MQGVAIAQNGDIIVVGDDNDGPGCNSGNDGYVVRIDPVTGLKEMVSDNCISSNALFADGLKDVAIAPNGDIIIAEENTDFNNACDEHGALISVNPVTGEQSLIAGECISNIAIFDDIQDVEIGPDGTFYVIDEDADAGCISPGDGVVIKVDSQGQQTRVSDNCISTEKLFVDMDGLALEQEAPSSCNAQIATFTITVQDGSGTLVVIEKGEICEVDDDTLEFDGDIQSVDGTGDYANLGLQCGEVDATVILNIDSASGTVDIIQCPEGITEPKKSNGGDNQWDTRPSFGISHETRQDQIVENGFSFNSEYFTVTDNHWTDFPEQSIEMGMVNTFSATVCK